MTNEFVVLSDIHGNAPALRSVIDREGDDAEYMVLGDVHGLLGYPKDTMDLVRSIEGFTIAGNHDRAIFQYGEGCVNSPELSLFERNHTLSNLTVEDVQCMLDLPYIQAIQRGQSRICMTHAYPWTDQASGMEPGNAGVRKRDVIHVASVVSDDYDYVFHGHTHEQYDLDCSKFHHDVHFVNPGTLGYDGTYSVVDTDTGAVTHKSVEVDMDAIRERLDDLLPDDCPSVYRWL